MLKLCDDEKVQNRKLNDYELKLKKNEH